MAEIISPKVIEEIKARVNIVDVIGKYVELSKAGRNYKGLCPFHGEKTPSFNVNPDGQFYHCFGCHAGGDVFKFLMEKEGLEFSEAVSRLGQQVGITVAQKELSPEEKAKNRLKHRISEIHQLSAQFFSQALFISDAAAARAYLRQRGISKPMVDLFNLGYSPASWETLYRVLLDKGFTEEECVASGVVIRSNKGQGAYDRFRGRLMFTIADEAGRPVAFGGRVLDDSKPKYLNSPETPIFRKGTHVYGLHLAKDSIRETGNVIVVEGYTDVIGLYQSGITNVVASLGTAFTEEQAGLLGKYCKEIIVAFDGDAAGEAATWRGMDMMSKAGFAVRVLEVPTGYDPDSYVRAKGSGAFQRLIDEAAPLIEFKIRHAFMAGDPRTVQGKVAIVDQVIPVLSGIDSIVEKTEYVQQVASDLGVSLDAVKAELTRYEEKTGKLRKSRNNAFKERQNRSGYAQRNASTPQDSVQSRAVPLEKQVLHGVLKDSRVFALVEKELGPDAFVYPLHQKLWQTLRRLSEEGKLIGLPNKIEQANTGALAAVVQDILHATPPVTLGQSYETCVLRLKEFQLRRELLDLANAAGSLGEANSGRPNVKAQLGDLLVRYKELKEEIDRVCMY